MAENFDFATESAELLERAVNAFAAWAAENWTMTEAEAQTLTNPTDAPSAYARGYNDAIASIPDAAALWMEDGQYD